MNRHRNMEDAMTTTTPVFRKILVPVDFSTSSEEAWDEAQRLASDLSAALLLLHVLVWQDRFHALEPMERAAGERSRHAAGELNIGGPRAAPETPETALQWTNDALAKWAAGPRDHGTSVQTLVRAGTPLREIVAAAREEKADLIVMGTHGRSGLEHLLVGSVADRVVRTAPCSVLLCSEGAAKPAA